MLTGFIGLLMPMFSYAQTVTFAQCSNPPTRVNHVDNANIEVLNTLYRKGYLQVQPPAKTAYQRYVKWHELGGVCTADLEDFTPQEEYAQKHSAWEAQLNEYRAKLSDPTEHLIQFLINQGTINPANLPVALKQLYQDKTTHVANEPVAP